MNQGKSYAGGVLLLTLASLAAKVCGVLFKIPLFALIGEDGMGYFNSAYVLYTFFYVFTTSGLPVGLSILISFTVYEEERRKWLKKALAVFGGAGSVICLCLMLFPAQLASLVGNPGAKESIFVLGPALLFVCLEGALRGYFQGKRNMLPTAVSQSLEALIRTGLGLFGAYTALKHGMTPAKASAAALCGIAAGGALSLLYLLICLRADQKKTPIVGASVNAKDVTVKRLLHVVLPVSAAAVVMSISSVIDLSVIMNRLAAGGLTTEDANRIYGVYSGLALPMFNLPMMLISPLASALVPHISAARAKGDGEADVLSNLSLRAATIFSLPFVVWFSILPVQLLDLLFDGTSAAKAAPMLALLAPSVLLVALTTVSGAILQASGKRTLPVVSTALGAIVKIVSSYFLISRSGINGAAIGTLLCYLVCALFNLVFIFRKNTVKSAFSSTCILFFCGVLSGGCAALCIKLLPQSPAFLNTFLCVLLSGTLYLSALVITGSIDRRLLLLLPKGEAIVRIIDKRQKHERKSKETD